MALSVGILTMHRVRNCGSFLQAYATQHFIESLGHKCETIDYVYPNEFHYKHQNSRPEYVEKSSWYDFFKSLVKHRSDAPIILEVRIFRWLVKHKLHLSYKTYHTQAELQKEQFKYDVVCVGSDQVWNPRFSCCDESFLLSFVDKKKISYASSLGTAELTDLERDFYAHHLSSFSSISVREKCNADSFQKILNRSVEIVVDPVFLLSRKEWCRTLHFHPSQNKHILYCVYGYMNDVHEIAEVLLSQHINEGKPIVSLTPLPSNDVYKCLSLVTPRKFVKAIAESSLIITDSFHVTAFAIIFGIPFIPICSSKTDDVRIKELLRMLYPPLYVHASLDDKTTIYSNSQTKKGLQQWIEKSKEYLKNAIES